MLTRGHWDKLGREVVEGDITVLLVLKCGDSGALEGTLGQSLVSWRSFTWPFHLPGCPCLASQEHLTPYHCLWIIRLFQEPIRPMEQAWVLGWPQDVRAQHLTHPCPCLSLGGRPEAARGGWLEEGQAQWLSSSCQRKLRTQELLDSDLGIQAISPTHLLPERE